MQKKHSIIVEKLKYYRTLIPIKRNFIILLFLSIVYFFFIKIPFSPSNTFYPVYEILSFIFFKFIFVFFSLSLINICITYFYIKYQLKKKKLILQTQFISQQNNTVKAVTQFRFFIKPLLGFIKIAWRYNNYSYTNRVVLIGRKNPIFNFKKDIQCINTLQLPDITAYHFSHSILFIEDMFQFFSLPIMIQEAKQLYNLPKVITEKSVEQFPKKTNEQTVRIDELRKVEGEYLHYKKFENSDDVRRIVWKIFAKNKELVVRIPETMDPFASTIYFYASFSTQFLSFDIMNNFSTLFLNYYKNIVWTLFSALSKQQFEVKYMSDQKINLPAHVTSNNQTSYYITLSKWQQDVHLSSYFKSSLGSILCIHSFNSEEEINELLSKSNTDVTIYFIQLSNYLKRSFMLHWLSYLFIKPAQDLLSKTKAYWLTHPTRYKTINHEKKLISLLQKSNTTFEIL